MSDPMQPGPEVPPEGAATPPVPPPPPVPPVAPVQPSTPVAPIADGGYFAPPPAPVPPSDYAAAAYPGGAYPGGAYPGGASPGLPGAYGPTRRTSGDAIGALVLSILSWVVCPLVPAIIALILAARADREIKAGGGWVEGEGMVTAARIVSWINIAVTGAAALFFIVLVAFSLVTTSSTVEFDTITV